MRVALYGHIFRYPLRAEEIGHRIGLAGVSDRQRQTCLDSLCAKGYLYRVGEFYSPENDPDLAERRTHGNQLAESKLDLAHRIARLIHLFPYVRSVMVSGSLSKDYMDEKSDLDYFVITRAGRLWLVKAAMVFIKRVILLGSYKYFCVNYLIDEEHLELEEKNQFTATELLTVIPITNEALYQRFWEANLWLKEVYPQAQPRQTARDREPRYVLKPLLEWLLGGRLGRWIDQRSMRTFQRRADRNYKANYAEKDYKVAFKSKKHVSKYHEKNFQRRVMDRYEELQRQFEDQHGVALS